jgi:undecaprenyl-diphosphatase
MTIFQAIILGIVQGATEFLPISSSGHLVLFPHLLGWEFPPQEAFVFDVLVQLGTLLAVIAYFWDDLLSILRAWIAGLSHGKPFVDQQSRLGWYLLLATIPAGIAGLLLKDQVEEAFTSITATAWSLLGTALLLLIAELLGRQRRSLDQLNWVDSLIIGIFQAFAIFPGVSRSGATITGGMIRHIERPAAARFSFLLAVPVMLAAGVVAVIDLLQIPAWLSFLPSMLAGFVTAALVGYLSIRWLLRYLVSNSLNYFAGYLIIVSVILLLQ